jgi:hypothetical protein
MTWTPQEAQRRVDQFFAKMRVVWGNGSFNQQFGNELDLKLAKQEFRAAILKPTDEELRMAFDHARRMIAEGNPDWRYPHPEKILAGAKRYQTAAHMPFLPEPVRPIVPPEEASKRCADLLDMLGASKKQANQEAAQGGEQ